VRFCVRGCPVARGRSLLSAARPFFARDLGLVAARSAGQMCGPPLGLAATTAGRQDHVLPPFFTRASAVGQRVLAWPQCQQLNNTASWCRGRVKKKFYIEYAPAWCGKPCPLVGVGGLVLPTKYGWIYTTPLRLTKTSHVSWAQDWQAARDAQRSPSLAQPPPRCSRSAPPTLLIAPAEPDPEGLPGAGQLQSGSETAAQMLALLVEKVRD
jgi:hypothetical protein